MTTSLAFLAPNLVKPAVEGRLPRGMGVARLVDAPAKWSRQHEMLGLPQTGVKSGFLALWQVPGIGEGAARVC